VAQQASATVGWPQGQLDTEHLKMNLAMQVSQLSTNLTNAREQTLRARLSSLTPPAIDALILSIGKPVMSLI
jgi:hypothetical protein